MIPYLVAIGLVEGTRFIKLDSDKKRFIVSFFCALIFILLLGLRHPIMGQDLLYLSEYGYIGGFHSIAESPWSIEPFRNYEIGYILFNKLISVFSKDIQVFLMVCAACSILPFAFVIYKSSQDIQSSFILLFGNPVFPLLYSGLRQSIAIGITFLTIELIKSKQLWLFILTICFAAQFHSSAYFFLLAYPLYHFGKLNLSIKIVLLAVIGILFIVRRYLFVLLCSLVSYSPQTSVMDENGAVNLFIICLLFLIFLFFKVKAEDKEINGYLKIYYLACLTLVFSNLNNIAIRVTFYFIDIVILLIPCLYKPVSQEANAILKQHTNGIWFIFVDLLFTVMGLFFILTTYYAKAFPYYFFWE